MKKLLNLLLLMVVLLMVASAWMLPCAMAEGTGTAPVAFDITPIVTAGIVLLGTALGAVLLWLTYKYIVPLLKVPVLARLARWGVDYAERELGRGNGDTKFDVATAFVMRILGLLHARVDEVAVKAAIVSAWTALNFEQIKAKIKEAVAKPPDESDGVGDGNG